MEFSQRTAACMQCHTDLMELKSIILTAGVFSVEQPWVCGVIFDMHHGTERGAWSCVIWAGGMEGTRGPGAGQSGKEGTSRTQPGGPLLPSAPLAPHNTTFLSTGPDSRARQKLWPRNWLEGRGGDKGGGGYGCMPHENTPLGKKKRELLTVLFYM